MKIPILILFAVYGLALTLALARKGFRSRGTSSGGTGLPAPARILVVGATGGTGRQIVLQALERGYAVTALARDPSKLGLEHPKLTVVRGDVLDPASLDAAVRGQDAVLSALGHRQYFRPTRILSEGTRNVLRAMETHGVSRFVCETSLGIGDSAGRLGLVYTFFTIPAVLPFYFWDKARQERVVEASPVDWILVRPAALTNGRRRGSVRHGPRAGGFLWAARISRADVAAFMLDQLTSDASLRTATGVCGAR